MTRRLVALLAVLAVVAASCAIGTDTAARPVDDAPEDLLDPTTTTAAPEPDEDDAFELVLMFVNSSGRRVPVMRTQDTSPTVQDVLDGLAGQPTEEEQAQHPENPITSWLLPAMAPTAAEVTNGVLRVNVAGGELRAIAQETPDVLTLVYGQIVCSVVGLEQPDVALVEVFDTDGRINALPEREVAPIEGPVGPEQYSDCATAAQIAQAEADAEEDTTTTTGS